MAVGKCVFCGCEQEDHKGTYLIKNDGTINYYCSNKCEKNHRVSAPARGDIGIRPDHEPAGMAHEKRLPVLVELAIVRDRAGAAVVEFTVDVPGTYLLVDHTLTRAIDRGAIGEIVVTGPEQPDFFSSVPSPFFQ